MALLTEMATIVTLGVGGAAALANYVPATRIPWTTADRDEAPLCSDCTERQSSLARRLTWMLRRPR